MRGWQAARGNGKGWTHSYVVEQDGCEAAAQESRSYRCAETPWPRRLIEETVNLGFTGTKVCHGRGSGMTAGAEAKGSFLHH